MITLFKPYVCNAAKENVMRVLDSPWLGMGKETEQFEKTFAEYIGAEHAIAVNSGTAALKIGVDMLKSRCGLDGRDIFLSTPNTFVSTNNSLLEAGFIVEFVDIDANTGCMDPKALETRLEVSAMCKREDVFGVAYVHYGGNPVHADRIKSICKDYNVPILEDAAHACGSSVNGVKIGNNSDDMIVTCFSFHAVKNLATGDGGMITTSSKILADYAKRLRWFGIDKSTAERMSAKGYSWEYTAGVDNHLGYKCHMNDITAAIGLGQLTMLDFYNDVRGMIVDQYKVLLEGSKVYPLTVVDKSSNHLMVVRFENKEEKEAAMARLRKNDIQYGYHYKPNYYHKAFQDLGNSYHFPNMELFYNTALTLPMHPFLQRNDVEKICKTIIGG